MQADECSVPFLKSRESSMSTSMPARRLEDRIRELCARVLYEKGPDWGATVHELQLAIQDHMLRVANLTAVATVAGKPEAMRERRRS